MADLIDRDKLRSALAQLVPFVIDDYSAEAYADGLSDAYACVCQQPSAEQKTGRWIRATGMMPPEHFGHYECSECGFWAVRDWLNKKILFTDYCPCCGLKMKDIEGRKR